MAQFDLHINRNQSSKKRVPYIINLQSDILDDLPTRIVVPVIRQEEYYESKIERLHIGFCFDDCNYIILIADSASIPVEVLGNVAANLNTLRIEITAALDLIFTGF